MYLGVTVIEHHYTGTTSPRFFLHTKECFLPRETGIFLRKTLKRPHAILGTLAPPPEILQAVVKTVFPTSIDEPDL
jgi:hypothetical protein